MEPFEKLIVKYGEAVRNTALKEAAKLAKTAPDWINNRGQPDYIQIFRAIMKLIKKKIP